MSHQSTREWILKAESDLKIGRDELATENPATDAICFHMQQCAEKYLKAFLIFHGKEIRKTHVIADLIRKCIQVDERSEEAVRALRAAETVRQFVRSILAEKGFS